MGERVSYSPPGIVAAEQEIGPYRLLHLLGRGGMGEVYAASHGVSGQLVAIKLIREDVAAEAHAVGRLLQEARALAQIEHPNIVEIFHCDRLADGRAYLAMEQLRGQSLRALLQSASVPYSQALELCAQVADGMAAAHASSVIHRDLKPENLFVCDGQVKILDFGIAKVPPPSAHSSQATQVETIAPTLLGTATYMAPEQCRNPALVGPAADVYALGVVLFELLCGQPPFVGDEPLDVLTQKLRDDSPLLADRLPDAPVGLSLLLSAMLDRNPALRPCMARVRDQLRLPWTPTSQPCPFPGLEPFSGDSSELHFGREDELAEVFARLRAAADNRQGEPLVILLSGPSGAGKTSFIQAGVIPRLVTQQSHSHPSSSWRTETLRPSAVGWQISTDATDELRPILLIADLNLPGSLSSHSESGASEVALIKKALADWASVSRSAVHCVLITSRCQEQAQASLWPGALQLHLARMSAAKMQDVVDGMCRRAGLHLAEGLNTRIVQDALASDTPLPLLGHLLRVLWHSRKREGLTHAQYEVLGGVGGALAQSLDEILAAVEQELGSEGRTRAKWACLSLIQTGRGAADHRRSRTFADLQRAAGDDACAQAVLRHLLRQNIDESASNSSAILRPIVSVGEQQYSLLHDALLTHVPTLRSWIQDERQRLDQLTDLERAAHDWTTAGSSAQELPSGSLLRHYAGTSQSPSSHVKRLATPAAIQFLNRAMTEERRRRRIQLALRISATLAFLCIAALASAAWHERTIAHSYLFQLLDSVDDVVSERDWYLAQLPGTLATRRKTLDAFQHIVDGLLSTQNWQARHMRIRLLQRRADLAYANDTIAQANALLAEAGTDIDRLSKQSNAQPEALAGLSDLAALNSSKLGKLALARGQLPDVHRAFAQALNHFEHAAQRSPDEDHLQMLATSLSEQGDLLLAEGHAEDATELHARALATLARIPSPTPSDYNRTLMALTQTSQAESELSSGKARAAAQHLLMAKAWLEPLGQAQPGNLFYRWALTRTMAFLALAELQAGAEIGATKSASIAEQAVALGNELTRYDAVNRNYALALLLALSAREQVQRKAGRVVAGDLAQSRRCSLARECLQRDPQDIRFHRFDCRPR
ncbi:serine/threonine-protein kinase [Haliangium sp. UPWRP_2]|uniref:serine/threonine-protein kinase n=1 Tax=Haliangium sp. UPWRP_2 TaxID=1931276 RepID=UPI000B5473C8|nr:serine/threonine-protein kinase [Haliangium sp. UPWRP_2]PSM32298.1 serine/threonine protein kinase [Haliangium sp. UPWRP_2]